MEVELRQVIQWYRPLQSAGLELPECLIKSQYMPHLSHVADSQPNHLCSKRPKNDRYTLLLEIWVPTT
jgi:hypothetical protein